VLGHRHLERSELADAGIRDPRSDMAIDDALRQMPEEVDHARMGRAVTGRHELVEQGFDPGPDATQAPGRGEQRG